MISRDYVLPFLLLHNIAPEWGRLVRARATSHFSSRSAGRFFCVASTCLPAALSGSETLSSSRVLGATLGGS